MPVRAEENVVDVGNLSVIPELDRDDGDAVEGIEIRKEGIALELDWDYALEVVYGEGEHERVRPDALPGRGLEPRDAPPLAETEAANAHARMDAAPRTPDSVRKRIRKLLLRRSGEEAHPGRPALAQKGP